MRYQSSLEIEQRLQHVLRLIQSGRHSTRSLAAEIDVSIPTDSRYTDEIQERGISGHSQSQSRYFRDVTHTLAENN
jgi:DNA-binding MarR family transcriptional regulator